MKHLMLLWVVVVVVGVLFAGCFGASFKTRSQGEGYILHPDGTVEVTPAYSLDRVAGGAAINDSFAATLKDRRAKGQAADKVTIDKSTEGGVEAQQGKAWDTIGKVADTVGAVAGLKVTTEGEAEQARITNPQPAQANPNLQLLLEHRQQILERRVNLPTGAAIPGAPTTP